LAIYNKLHNKDFDIVIDWKSAKEIPDRLQLMHEGDTSSFTIKIEKR